MDRQNFETHDFNAEVSKVLKLMIHSLYANRDIFLRELISNASDACDKLRYQAITRPELLSEDSQLSIHIMLNKDARTITIRDNGIGMNREDLISNLGTIARSGTQDFIGKLEESQQKQVPLIGQFGVGFYSAFIVAERITVASRKAEEAQSYLWESEGVGQFRIAPLEGAVARGTSITLHLREDAAEYLDKFRLKHITQTYSDHISFPIYFVEADGKQEILNTAAALWTRPKSDISDEQYKEFYHHVAHSPDTPWMVLHNKNEGTLEYTNLLFIPAIQPFDLFHPDRKRRVKLYVKKVFITDEGTDLVPHYLRFLRGIIDSEDLPLNISRETLQKNSVLDRIRDSVVKRTLSELKKRAEKNPEDYAIFWKNFGAVLKEGLCEAIAPKEAILDASRFASTNGEGLTSLDDYIGRMKNGQQHIFYHTGDNAAAILSSPQLEGFRKRGIEVLLLTDHVDDFWVNVVPDYKKHAFKSVTRSDIDLSAIECTDSKNDSEEKPQQENKDSNLDALISALKKIYGSEVKDVRVTQKLEGSPVCLSVEDGAMDIRLERFLREQKQLNTEYAKILEINPHHSLIQHMASSAGNPAMLEDECFKDIAALLLDQAKIACGLNPSDISLFNKRINMLSERLLNQSCKY